MDNKRIIKILFLNFLTMATFNIAHPVTPTLINTVGLPTYTFGVFYSVMAIAQFVMAPIWGSISDNRGRKNLLILGVLGYGISQLGFGFIENPFVIVLFRFLGGAMSVGFITVAIAYVSDVSTKEERTKYMAYHTATMSIASSAGALLGGTLGSLIGYKLTFFSQFLLSIVVSLVIYLLIDETISKKDKRVKVYLDHLTIGRKSIDLKSTIGVMMIVIALVTIATTSYNSTINYYIESVLNMPSSINGVVMAVAGIIALIMNLFVNPYLSKRFKERNCVVTMLLISGIAIIVASICKNIVIAMLFLGLFIASSALITPMQQSMISKLVKDNYGEVMGIQGSFKALGMITGSLVSGFIFDYGNKLPFVIGGLCCIVAFFILTSFNKHN